MSLWVLTLKLGYLRLECSKVLVNIVLRAIVLNRCEQKIQNVAMYLLARVGLITPAAKEVAARRMMAMRMEEEMRRDRRN